MISRNDRLSRNAAIILSGMLPTTYSLPGFNEFRKLMVTHSVELAALIEVELAVRDTNFSEPGIRGPVLEPGNPAKTVI